MLTAERHARVLEVLARDGRVVTGEVAGRLGVSLDTVRRDLLALEGRGALRRVRGGALPPVTSVPAEHAARRDRRSAEKAAIAARAAELVPRSGVVLLGGGTTMVELARRWPPGGPTTALTPSLDVAGALAGRPGIEVVLLGGRVLPQARTTAGAETVAALAGVRADACVLGTCSLDAAVGASLLDREEAQVARAMVAGARTVTVLADADKLGTTAPFAVAPTDRIDTVVTDASAPADVVGALREQGAKVVRA